MIEIYGKVGLVGNLNYNLIVLPSSPSPQEINQDETLRECHMYELMEWLGHVSCSAI